jgi:hypothetical protein
MASRTTEAAPRPGPPIGSLPFRAPVADSRPDRQCQRSSQHRHVASTATGQKSTFEPGRWLRAPSAGSVRRPLTRTSRRPRHAWVARERPVNAHTRALDTSAARSSTKRGVQCQGTVRLPSGRTVGVSAAFSASSDAATVAGRPRFRTTAPRGVCFSHNVQRGPRLRQLGLKFRVAGSEPFQLHHLRGLRRLFYGPRGPPRIGHTRQSAGSRAHSITCREYRPLGAKSRPSHLIRGVLILRNDRPACTPR